MADEPIRFDDGAGYEEMMGKWSRIAGEIFLDWLRPAPGLSWVDVGCGNGAFTELLAERCAPKSIVGVDPSPGQLAYARQRHRAGIAEFVQGGAESLPLPSASVDAATMALVIFFVPDPAAGIAEMRRVVRPGGTVSTYAWDMASNGFPWEPIYAAMRERGLTPQRPPRIDASTLQSMDQLWRGAGLEQVETREIQVERPFASFDEFWASSAMGPVMKQRLQQMPEAEVASLKQRTEALMPRDGNGRILYKARANAAKGIVPT